MKLPPLDVEVVPIKLINNQVDDNCGPHPCHILEVRFSILWYIIPSVFYNVAFIACSYCYQATTAASSNDLWNLERLETLGDSFLKLAVSLLLYDRFPDFSEGKMTEIKGQILGNRNLFYCAKAKQLQIYMKVCSVLLWFFLLVILFLLVDFKFWNIVGS